MANLSPPNPHASDHQPGGPDPFILLVPTAVQTANFNAAINTIVPCNATGGSFTVTLPTAPADGATIAIKLIATASSHTVAFATGGSDVLNIAGTTSQTLSSAGQVCVLQYRASAATWYDLSNDQVSGGGGAVSSVSNSDGTLAVSPTTGAVVASRSAITGDVSIAGGSNAATVTALNGTALSGLATGLLKNTTGTGVPSIAAAGTDYMAAAPTAGGDLSGTLPSPTVAQVNGVAITAAEATLMSQMNGANVLASASLPATLVAGSQTIITGSTAGTATLPDSTAQASSVCYVKNISTALTTVAAGAGTTVNYNGTTGSFILGPNTGAYFVLIGAVWYVIGYDGIGQQVAYNQVTANYTALTATAGTMLQADTTSGTAPTITLPNDGRLYRVEFYARSWSASTSNNSALSFGTSVSAAMASAQVNGLPTVATIVPPLHASNITGSGQVIKVYDCTLVAAYTITIYAAAANQATDPSYLAAYRVG